jgi:nucleoside-diphosphate-sugar epimerase
MDRLPADGATLVTGASGFLGSLAAAALVAHERRPVVLPIRAAADPSQCRQRLREELLACGVPHPHVADLIHLAAVTGLPALSRFSDLAALAAAAGVDEIVHCAGCVDYFDDKGLQQANVELTARLLETARTLGVRRFIYLSTAYCAGYGRDHIPEQLHPHPEPTAEPTAYTRTKRMAEWLIADSGIPFLIIRPSIVIGDSRTGRYSGKNYGLYQMWRAIEGLLCREYAPVWHTIASRVPVNLLHQDSFQNGFLGSYQHLGPGAIIHLVSDDASSPTLRELTWLWADVYHPAEIRCYPGIDDVPLASLPRRQRRFLELAWKNFEIATQPWRFETTALTGLRRAGLPFTDATLGTVARCQQRYIERSTRIQEHTRRYGGLNGMHTTLTELCGAATGIRAVSPG